jgi:hypothetical protein
MIAPDISPYRHVNVLGTGESAYLNNGTDARQLWVRANGQIALVMVFGDKPNGEGAKAVARLVVAAIR